ncbi:uroporphyrinogen-III C-methyltransferase [Marinagarivorans algicola]|uniref:uroporphyrinogen-III C-methyltransferase n=1 Tax=Marinagarivorans algicola TaxID=1513270 RepID=UPI0006B9E0EA|nr:uroporphyrinogen-III C-methyltransferase [Marinagarivorans algicola]
MSDKPQTPDSTTHRASTDDRELTDNASTHGSTQQNTEQSPTASPNTSPIQEPAVDSGDEAIPSAAATEQKAVTENKAAVNEQEALTPDEPSLLPPNSALSSKDTSAPDKQRSTKGVWFVVVFMLLGWGATAFGGYWVYLQQQASAQSTGDLTAQLGEVKAQVQQTLAQSQSKATRELTEFKQGVNAELKAIEREAAGDLQRLAGQIKEHEARLNGQQTRLAGLTTTSREDWLLAEAEYLLKLANQRVLLERTPDNVVALLSRADEIVERVSAGLGDRELFAIRKVLAEEITALKMVEPVDTQGIYLKLGAVANTINNLATLPAEQERFSALPATTSAPLAQVSSTQTDVSETFIEEFKREMGNFFIFVRSAFSWYSEDELANPIVSQQRLQLMQLNTRLLIEQAQIALLKEEPVTYSESLKSASALASQYYFDSPARQTLVNELQALAQKNIAPELPDISESLKLLHTYSAAQHRINAPSAGQLSSQGAQ